jgi:ATP-dependent DNA helicase RecG
MYDDRLEFQSPGKLPSIVTVENIQNTRFSRNPVIARTLSDFGWVRELNEGVKRIYVDMSNYFLEPPEFSEPNNNTVKLTLKNNLGTRSLRNIEAIESKLEFVWLELKPLDRNIVFYIANTGSCTPSDLIKLTKRARPTIKAHTEKLIELGIIEEHSTSPKDPTKYFTIKNY